MNRKKLICIGASVAATLAATSVTSTAFAKEPDHLTNMAAMCKSDGGASCGAKCDKPQKATHAKCGAACGNRMKP